MKEFRSRISEAIAKIAVTFRSGSKIYKQNRVDWKSAQENKLEFDTMVHIHIRGRAFCAITERDSRILLQSGANEKFNLLPRPEGQGYSKVFLSWLLMITLVCSLPLCAQKTTDNFKPYDQSVPGSSLQFKMMPIPAGSFTMGSNENEKSRNADEGPQKKVSISPFWMSAFEVSRDAFDVFYKDESVSQNDVADAVTRPSPQYIDFSLGMGKEDGYPVNSLSQYAALMYCRWLYIKTGIFYRLPTEAEWEYACRAGSTSTYFFGDDASQLTKYGWYSDNSENKFHKSGQKSPNAWGLYDMLGNVSEWTLDHYDQKYLDQIKSNSSDPFAPVVNSKYPKVLKGGGYLDDASQLRIANRIKSDPSWNKRDPQIPKSKWWLTEAPSVGFRIVRPVKQPTSEEIEAFYRTYMGK